MTTYLKQLIECHEGTVNRLIHLVGFVLIGFGLMEKSLMLVIAGFVVPESGHFYQYAITKNIKQSPLFCFRPQLIYVFPLFVLAVLYVVLAK